MFSLEGIKKQVENQCFANTLMLLPHSPSSDPSLLAHELRESPAPPPLSFPLLPTTLFIAMGMIFFSRSRFFILLHAILDHLQLFFIIKIFYIIMSHNIS